MTQFVSYRRCSTNRQSESGLGLMAQEQTIQEHVARIEGSELIADYCEVESGKRTDRTEFLKAVAHSKRTNSVLICAKLDRMMRNPETLAMIRRENVRVFFCDLPETQGPVGDLMVGIMCSFATFERERLVERIKEGLAQSDKRSGNPDGGAALAAWTRKNGNGAAVEGARNAADKRAEIWRPVFEELHALGLSLAGMARKLDADGVRTARDSAWTATACRRMIGRLGLATA